MSITRYPLQTSSMECSWQISSVPAYISKSRVEWRNVTISPTPTYRNLNVVNVDDFVPASDYITYNTLKYCRGEYIASLWLP